MGSSASKIVPQLSQRTLAEGIPTSFQMNLEFNLIKDKLELVCNDADRVLLVNMPWGYSGPMVLYDGPTKDFPPMLIVLDANTLGLKFPINLPAVPSEGVGPRTELIKRKMGLMGLKYWFGVDVISGPYRRTEAFEWRHSRSDEVRGDHLFGSGWKLVRMQGGGDKYIDDQSSNDESEVVAVWRTSNFSISKMGTFEIIGSGLLLGDSFKLMAIGSIIAIRVNTLRRRRRNNSNSTVW